MQDIINELAEAMSEAEGKVQEAAAAITEAVGDMTDVGRIAGLVEELAVAEGKRDALDAIDDVLRFNGEGYPEARDAVTLQAAARVALLDQHLSVRHTSNGNARNMVEYAGDVARIDTIKTVAKRGSIALL